MSDTPKNDVKEIITFETIMEKCKELENLFQHFNGWQQNVAAHCILNLVLTVAEDQFQGMGMLQEVSLRYREVIEEIINEEHVCDECDDNKDSDESEDDDGKFNVN